MKSKDMHLFLNLTWMQRIIIMRLALSAHLILFILSPILVFKSLIFINYLEDNFILENTYKRCVYSIPGRPKYISAMLGG
jgi:hypothetical protein